MAGMRLKKSLYRPKPATETGPFSYGEASEAMEGRAPRARRKNHVATPIGVAELRPPRSSIVEAQFLATSREVIK
jgi:hypothetical protein